MKDMINIAEILKNCKAGTKLYSPMFGEVYLSSAEKYIFINYMNSNSNTENTYCLNQYGQADSRGECLLFPSKDQRDWTKFKVKKEKFDPYTLKPFDKVLEKYTENSRWYMDFFGRLYRDKDGILKGDNLITNSRWVIPYNEDTKHLVNSDEDCHEYYKWWEE